MNVDGRCSARKLESGPQMSSPDGQRILVMESSEDRTGTHDIGLFAAMTGCRSRNRSNPRIGNPGPTPCVGAPDCNAAPKIPATAPENLRVRALQELYD